MLRFRFFKTDECHRPEVRCRLRTSSLDVGSVTSTPVPKTTLPRSPSEKTGVTVVSTLCVTRSGPDDDLALLRPGNVVFRTVFVDLRSRNALSGIGRLVSFLRLSAPGRAQTPSPLLLTLNSSSIRLPSFPFVRHGSYPVVCQWWYDCLNSNLRNSLFLVKKKKEKIGWYET